MNTPKRYQEPPPIRLFLVVYTGPGPSYEDAPSQYARIGLFTAASESEAYDKAAERMGLNPEQHFEHFDAEPVDGGMLRGWRLL